MATHSDTHQDNRSNNGGDAAAATRAIGRGEKSAQGAASAERTLKGSFDTASEAMSRSTDEAKEGIDQLRAQSEVALRKSGQNLEAVADAGGCMMQGATEISTAWMNLAQGRTQRMAEGFRNLATCRTPADLIHAQSELVQGNLKQLLDTNRRVVDVSMRTMQDVAARMTRPLGDRTA